MRARLYICDVCGELEDKTEGGAFHIFRYKTKSCGFTERRKMVLCHSCFCNMIEFCRTHGSEELHYTECEDN